MILAWIGFYLFWCAILRYRQEDNTIDNFEEEEIFQFQCEKCEKYFQASLIIERYFESNEMEQPEDEKNKMVDCQGQIFFNFLEN